MYTFLTLGAKYAVYQANLCIIYVGLGVGCIAYIANRTYTFYRYNLKKKIIDVTLKRFRYFVYREIF